MFHFLRQVAFISPITLALGLGSGCDVSNGTGPGKEQQPDPVVVDIPIAFIARSIPIDSDPEAEGAIVSQDILDPSAFNPGAKLIFKDRAKFSAPELDLTSGLFPISPKTPTMPTVTWCQRKSISKTLKSLPTATSSFSPCGRLQTQMTTPSNRLGTFGSTRLKLGWSLR